MFTPLQKQEIIRRLTETMVLIEGENLRPVTWIVIDEVKSGEWGSGGILSQPLTPKDRGWQATLNEFLHDCVDQISKTKNEANILCTTNKT